MITNPSDRARSQWATRASAGLGTSSWNRCGSGPTRFSTPGLISRPSGSRIQVGWLSPGFKVYASFVIATLRKPRAWGPGFR